MHHAAYIPEADLTEHVEKGPAVFLHHTDASDALVEMYHIHTYICRSVAV